MPDDSYTGRHARRLLTIGEGLVLGALCFGGFVFVTEPTGGLWTRGERVALVLLGILLFGIGRGGFLVAMLRGVSPEQKQARIRRWQRSLIGGLLLAGGLIAIHHLLISLPVILVTLGSVLLGVLIVVLGLWALRHTHTTTNLPE